MVVEMTKEITKAINQTGLTAFVSRMRGCGGEFEATVEELKLPILSVSPLTAACVLLFSPAPCQGKYKEKELIKNGLHIQVVDAGFCTERGPDSKQGRRASIEAARPFMLEFSEEDGQGSGAAHDDGKVTNRPLC